VCARNLHGLGFIRLLLDERVQPFPERHAGTAGGVLRGLPRFLVDAFDAPRDPWLHADYLSLPLDPPRQTFHLMI
jgi:hypothetical protein